MMLDFTYDEQADILTVEGVKYTGDMFRELGTTLPLGMAFQILDRQDGAIYLQRLEATH